MHMLLKVFFHFFGRRLSDNADTVIVDFYALVTLAVFVFGFADYNLLYKFVYDFRCQLRKLRYFLCFVDKTL